MRALDLPQVPEPSASPYPREAEFMAMKPHERRAWAKSALKTWNASPAGLLAALRLKGKP